MNSLTLLTIATMATLAISARYFWLDLDRERRRNRRLLRDLAYYRDELQAARELIEDLDLTDAIARHPANGSPARLSVIQGGAR